MTRATSLDIPAATDDPWTTGLGEALATLLVGAVVAAACLLLAHWIPNFFWHDDNQNGGIPGLFDIARSLKGGEWPLLSPYTWNGAAIMGEYCGGVFSPLVISVNLIATAFGGTMAGVATIGASILSAVAAMGAFRVARQEGIPIELASMVALVASLNGWLVAWASSNWVPALAGFATVTWAWWALAAAVKPAPGVFAVLGAGMGVFLVMTAGWPHTIFMLALVTAWLVSRAAWQQRNGWPLLAACAGWLLGIGLASPAWMPFLAYLSTTMRPATATTMQWQWLVPISSLPGLVMPVWMSRWESFTPDVPHVAIELANGLVTTAALVGALATAQRGRAFTPVWLLLLAAIGLFLSIAPSYGMFRWSFRWLPLFHFAAALAAAKWLTAVRSGPPPPPAWARDPSLTRVVYNPGAWTLLIALAGTVVIAHQPTVSVVLPVISIGLAAVWTALGSRLSATHPLLRWAPASITLTVLLTTYHQLPSGLAVPSWRLPESILSQAPLQPNIRYFGLVSAADYFGIGPNVKYWGGLIRPGNTMMLGAVHFVNGYSALQHRGLRRAFYFGVHGFVEEWAIARHARILPAAGGLLSRLGVDGLVVGRSQEDLVPVIAAQGWRVTHSEPEGILLHRVGAPSQWVRSVPGVRFVSDEDLNQWRAALDQHDGIPAVAAEAGRPAGTMQRLAPRVVRTLAERRNAITIDVAPGPERAIIGVSRVWLPGYEAFTAAGIGLSIVALDGITIGIEVPAGVGGPITLRYLPRALVYGLWLAGGTAAFMVAMALGWWRFRRV